MPYLASGRAERAHVGRTYMCVCVCVCVCVCMLLRCMLGWTCAFLSN